jgi:hypothetical protein
MTRLWYDERGFPIDHPKMLMDALRTIPGAALLSEERIRGLAEMVEAIADGGREMEAPRNLSASPKASDGELVKFHDLCEKLAAHIGAMHQPSTSALWAEGISAFDLLERLKSAMEAARHAFGSKPGDDRAQGRPQKIEASEVTDIVASIYEEISGRRPTFSTNPANGAVSGAWPDALQSVFAALYISASVPAQVKAHREKRPSC